MTRTIDHLVKHLTYNPTTNTWTAGKETGLHEGDVFHVMRTTVSRYCTLSHVRESMERVKKETLAAAMPTTDYTPQAGDLARDADNDLWFVYADPDTDQLHGITPSYDPFATGYPLDDAQRLWGPLTLEHRPA